MTPDDFQTWADRWIELATFSGEQVSGEEGRIDAVIELWHAPIPSGWQRAPDARLLDRERRYRRSNAGDERAPGEKPIRRGEHVVEHQILEPLPTRISTTCFGDRLVDGVNAVPLAKDVGGGRAGNVEADMALLVRCTQGQRLLLVEVKVESNNAWYAAVENLRQMRLFSESSTPRAVFQTRLPELRLPDDLPTTAVVLAPRDFYIATGKRAAAVRPAQNLLDRMREEAGIEGVLATWNSAIREIDTYRAV